MASIFTGSQLGPYEIVSAIGAGGMGEVYKAVDKRLGRMVAIKVLGAAVSEHIGSRERFEREARTISSLNHPHICTLYDVGRQDDVDYLVMEYLEGETLAAALERGAMPVKEAIDIAIQIGDALDKAHRQGVVHRDLKPGNVMLTKNGAKLLDFGLAKLRFSETPVAMSVTALPTDARNLTGAGTILGTLQYMSPEQLEGKEADARSDIFAFGATLYEMLTGKKAFNGKTQVSLMASILEHEPPSLTSVQPILPEALERIVHACLVKEPEERWQTARDLARELKWIHARGEKVTVEEIPLPAPRSRKPFLIAFGAAVILTLAAVAGMRFLSPKDPLPPLVRFDVSPTAETSFVGSPPRFSVSPNGRYVVFSARGNGKPERLWLRRLDSTEAQPIAGTEIGPKELAPQSPFWSPDSKYIAFFVQTENGSGGSSRLKKVDTEGGPIQTIGELPSNNAGGSWNSDGTILIATSGTKGIQRIPSTGGVAVQVTTLDKNEQSHLFPQFLPDGRHFIYQSQVQERDKWAMVVGSLDSPDRKLLVQTEYAQFASPDQLLYMRGDALLSHTIDLKKYELIGEPKLISKSLLPNNAGNGRSAFSASQAGVLVYAANSGLQPAQGGNRLLVWSDRDGKMSAPLSNPIQGGVRLSPDGKNVALSEAVSGSVQDILVLNLERNVTTRLTTDPAADISPIWTPDGSHIIFSSNRDKKGLSLFIKASNGAVNEELLLQRDEGVNLFPTQVSPDGKWLIFLKGKEGRRDIWVLPLSGERKPVPYVATAFDQLDAMLSPNGKWLAYSSTEPGRYEVIVQPFPDPAGGKWQVSTSGGRLPQWRKDGKELFYNDLDEHLVAVSVTTEGAFQIGQKNNLFDTPYGALPPTAVVVALYDVTADGQRFLLSIPSGRLNSGPANPLTVLLNWTSALK